MDNGYIILRDVPKEQAGLDLTVYQIQGGFRGFDLVPPGLHHASVKLLDRYVGFWCWVPAGGGLVRVFDPEQGFGEDTPEAAAQYGRLARSGAMAGALIPYDHTRYAHWLALTGHIAAAGFPPAIHTQDLASFPTRFDQAFLGSHGGKAEAFLGELQYSFLRWFMSLQVQPEEKAALARWRHLLLACYNVGEERIRERPAFFSLLVAVLIAQMQLLPDTWFAPRSFLTAQASYLAEDMVDTGIEEAVKGGQLFANYLQTRQRP